MFWLYLSNFDFFLFLNVHSNSLEKWLSVSQRWYGFCCWVDLFLLWLFGATSLGTDPVCDVVLLEEPGVATSDGTCETVWALIIVTPKHSSLWRLIHPSSSACWSARSSCSSEISPISLCNSLLMDALLTDRLFLILSTAWTIWKLDGLDELPGSIVVVDWICWMSPKSISEVPEQ